MIARSPVDRNGFTLLEVVLAVALTAIIGTLIATAIDFHLRQLTVQRTRIEEAQVARAVLRRIADDLRAATVYRPADAASPSEMSSDAADGSSTDGSSTDDGSGSAPTSSDYGSSDDTGTANTSAVSLSTPGLFGDQFTLQVDVSRDLRYEEFVLAADLNDPAFSGALSDMKTISYFISDSAAVSTSSVSASSGAGVDAASQTGLARRVADRAATRFAVENGIFELVDQDVEVFAPEVVAIEFAYFDGLEWTLEWDSDLRGGLPIAVEITLVVMPAEQAEAWAVGGATDTVFDEVDADSVYRLVVHLPGSDLEQLAAAEAETLDDGMGAGL